MTASGHPTAPVHVRRMQARSPHELHRASTPLELLFDLVFVVAIAQAADALHHAVIESHAAAGLVGYLMVFFAIWWAWMNFTWFASAYDCDDVPYRVLVFVQITGALILAAGVPGMSTGDHTSATVVAGYVVMRLALVAQWSRASASDPERRQTTRRYAAGIAALQAVWVASAFLSPHQWMLAFPFLVALEMLVPFWAERAGETSWHPHHIAERYGLLTLIVLGESILSATVAVETALSGGSAFTDLAEIVVGGLLIVFSMWWVYFDRPAHAPRDLSRRAFIWGYGHYAIFASAAAVGAGLGVAVDQASGAAHISSMAAGAAVAWPVAVFLLGLSLLQPRPQSSAARWLAFVVAVLLMAAPVTGHAVFAAGVLIASLAALKTVLEPGTGVPSHAS